MTQAPTVSVIVPTHNRAGLLTATLRTLLWQRDVDLEIVVVDDGGDDNTAGVLAGLGDPRLRLVRHDRPRGVATARNRGIAEARGHWVAFCDDDDLWAPDKLIQQLEAAQCTGRSWTYAGAVKIDLANRIVGGKPPPHEEEFVRRLPRRNMMPGGCSNAVVKASTLARAGTFDTALINVADWDLWIRLAREGPPARVGDPLVGYRFHRGNRSLDTRLILHELDLMDGRYGATVDRAEAHNYLAYLCMRSGRRAEALRHFAIAAVRGRPGPVARQLLTAVATKLPRLAPALTNGPESERNRLWRAAATAWLEEVPLP